MQKIHIVVFTFLLFFAVDAYSQAFQFGVTGGYVASQVEGDGLKGFHQPGYIAGLLGGYSINRRQWVVVECTFQQFGSRLKNESSEINQQNITDLHELEFKSVGTLIGFSQKLGSDWDGNSKLRVQGGLRLHGIISKDVSTVRRNGGPMNNPVPSAEDLSSFMLNLSVGMGAQLTDKVFLDVSYDHSLNNISDNSSGSELMKVVPYYLSLRLSYYVFDGFSRKI